MTKYKQSFEKCVSKIQRTQDAHRFWRQTTEITSSINSRVRLWKINHVTMTPGWPCNKPDLTIKGTTLYSAAMTPGKHGPHKYP